jgi:hypothetical protein
MDTAAQPGNTFKAGADQRSVLVNFAPDRHHEQLANKGTSGTCQGSTRRHLKLVGTPIDVAFGQVDILWKLDRGTLERMATDPATPVAVLERLAAHPIAEVRAVVSENENTPLFTLWSLSKDADADVRYQLAENHNLPLSLVRSLTRDENPYVAFRAQQTCERLQANQAH